MIPDFLVTRFGPTGAKLVFFGGIALLVIAALVGFIAYERHVGATGEVVKEQARTIETQKKVGVANENAAGKRIDDTLKGEAQKKEITDAELKATSPDDARRRRGCVILRQQGRDISAIPACRGSSN